MKHFSMIFNFLVVLEFKLRAFHLLGEHSTTLTTPPALFVLVYSSDKVSHFSQASRGA
jgi:hypothetical protein